jgi:hypothetical protein
MADVIQRTWRSGPRKVKRTAWGYTVQVNGKQERRFDAAWSKEDAQTELTARLKQIADGVERLRECTLAELAKEYFERKKHEGKRSVSDDKRMLDTRMLPALGPGLKVRQLHETAIAQYANRRLGEVGHTRSGTSWLCCGTCSVWPGRWGIATGCLRSSSRSGPRGVSATSRRTRSPVCSMRAVSHGVRTLPPSCPSLSIRGCARRRSSDSPGSVWTSPPGESRCIRRRAASCAACR